MNKIKIGNKCFVTENARVQLGLAEGDVYEVFNILKEAFRPIILKRGCDLIGRVGANEIILIKDIVLTTYQKDFLLNNFFENTSYAGWRGIATTLLETGECVVAGDKCIWVGGIGNFIEIKKAEGFLRFKEGFEARLEK